jgi:hypothetical protein
MGNKWQALVTTLKVISIIRDGSLMDCQITNLRLFF